MTAAATQTPASTPRTRPHRIGMRPMDEDGVDQAVIEPAVNWLSTEVAEQVKSYTRAEQMPESIIAGAARVGLWAPFLPAEWGGLGVSWRTYGRLQIEQGAVCGSLPSKTTASEMVARAIWRFGGSAAQQRWLPGMASGQTIGAFCLTGTSSGTTTVVTDTVATRSGAGWVLDGAKKWTTNATNCDLLLVFASTEDGMTAFLVPRQAEGVSAVPIRGMRAARANDLGEMHFDRVELGPDAVLGPVGMAAGLVMSDCLGLGRFSVACRCVGFIRTLVQETINYTTSRELDGGVWLSDQSLVQADVEEMITGGRAARGLCADVARMRDRRDPDAPQASRNAKKFASEAAHRAAETAVVLHGARGLAEDSVVGRIADDARGTRIIEGPRHLNAILAGRRALRRKLVVL
jgi:alkylation response protein AidB-like acyl-CoA dehydrogenase